MFTIEGVMEWGEIEQIVRETPLLDDQDIFPYENATITLVEDMPYADVDITHLCTSRVLMRTQALIGKDITPSGYHQLKLTKGLLLGSVNIFGEPTITGLWPPIVEEFPGAKPYLIDGNNRAHRRDMTVEEVVHLKQSELIGQTALLKSATMNVIHITGIREDCPAPAYPNKWDEVALYEGVPAARELHKNYRNRYYYRYCRDFGRSNGNALRYGMES